MNGHSYQIQYFYTIYIYLSFLIQTFNKCYLQNVHDFPRQLKLERTVNCHSLFTNSVVCERKREQVRLISPDVSVSVNSL